jgi:hypothetical protein
MAKRPGTQAALGVFENLKDDFSHPREYNLTACRLHNHRIAYETPARVALPLLARLKLTLIRRHFQRNPLGGVGTAIAAVVFTLVLSGAALSAVLGAHAGGPAAQSGVMLWSCWILTLLILNAPLSQFDTQRSMDFSALRLLPLSGATFTRAVLLDAVVSPQGIFTALPTLVLVLGLPLSLAELPLIALSFALLYVSSIAFGQALFLTLSRLISSRRFADISIVVGMVMVFAFQGVNLLLHTTARELGVPPWMVHSAHTLRDVFGPIFVWLFPGAAAGVVNAAATGEPLLAAAKATALVAQCALGLYLANRSTRAFYEGEVESGGMVRQKKKKWGRSSDLPTTAGLKTRATWHVLSSTIAAIYFRERAYLWRDPLLKSLFLQSVLSVAYFSMAGVFIAFKSGDEPLFPKQYLLLGIALMLNFSESYLLFNKLGLEGMELTAALLTPVPRARILRGKSLFFLAHFLTLNALIVGGLGIALGVAPLFICAALALLAGNACVVDVAGHFVSIWFPHAYRRTGRHYRPQFAQTGCGYMLVYGLVTQLCNLAALPGGAAIVLGAVFGGWAGLMLGAVSAGLIAWAAYAFGLPYAALQLAQREPEVLEALGRKE